MELEHGDVVLCIVDKIAGTTVFVNVEGSTKRGSIVFSEVSPGRIRNIREFVVPKKTICCKILKISNDNIELSLRRVTQKEQKEVMEQYKIEKSYISVLKTVLKEKTEKTIEKIKETSSIYDFLEETKENSKNLEKLVGKEDTQKIIEILSTQKKKTVIIKKIITMHSTNPNGLSQIKELIKYGKDAEIKYIAAGKYSIKMEDENMKRADTKITEIIEKLEKEAKNLGFEFNFK
jgi:translation initiation factor 2 alpha subunit (eIF-2alpha)